MLLPKAQSHRASCLAVSGRELLDTEYNGKQLRVWITHKPIMQPDPKELGESGQVHVAILSNHHEITKSIGDILKKSRTGEAVVIVCKTPKAYQSTLSFLGYNRITTAKK